MLLILGHLYNYKFLSPTHCQSVPYLPSPSYPSWLFPCQRGVTIISMNTKVLIIEVGNKLSALRLRRLAALPVMFNVV